MDISFRDIAAFMDPAQPVSGLRQLAERHRWPREGSLPSPFSFRDIGRRHIDTAGSSHRLLWYNTALLPGFTINLCDPRCLFWIVDKAALSPSELLKNAGILPLQVLEAFGFGKNSVVEAFGISLDQLKSEFESLLNSLVGIITGGTVTLDDILGAVSLGEIVSAFNITLDQVLNTFGLNPLDVIVKFCSHILDYLGLPLTLSVGEQPDLNGRATGIAAMLADNKYDIAAMCEVFTPNRQEQLLTDIRAGAPDSSIIGVAGPDSSGNAIDSGLYTVGCNLPLLYSASREFSGRGNELIDSDAWANKGVLLSCFDLGMNRRVEIFSTHLISGGDLANEVIEKILSKIAPWFVKEYTTSIEQHVFATKMAQIDELLQFYREHHRPENVAVVVGDLNLDAHTPKEYTGLIQKMYGGGLKLLDSWPYHRLRPPTGAPKPEDAMQITAEHITPRGSTHSDYKHNEVCVNDTKDYCDDAVDRGGGRIDFVFIEAQASQSYVFDITRIQRRAFHRDSGGEPYLSDHLGLDFTFRTSPVAAP